MQKIIYLSFIVALIFTVTACTKTDITFGNQYLDNGNTQIIRIDTFGPAVSTIFTDSFPTASKGVTLVGGYNDPYFGKINAQTFLEIAAPSYVENSYNYTQFDSINLILKIKKNNYYGDTTQPLHIDVNKLTENIVLFDNNYTLYNVDKFNYNTTALGSTNIVVRPYQTDTISIRLSDAFGKQLFGMLQRGSDTIKTASVFLDFFKGLRLGGGTNKMVLGCTDSVLLRINYKQAGLYLTNLKVDFPTSNTSHHFTNVTADRTGTSIATLNANKHEISSTLTGNAGYTQTATGITAKITFPSIRDVLKITNYVKLLKAVLIVRPAQSTFSSFYYVPPQLRLSATNQLNLLGSDLTAISANGAAATQYGNLVTDYTFGQNTAYTYDVTNYLKALINDPSTNVLNGVLIAPPSNAYETDLSRIVIANKNNNSNSNFNIALQIYYAAIQL